MKYPGMLGHILVTLCIQFFSDTAAEKFSSSFGVLQKFIE
ncbi:hypothetical protein L21SP2_2357 [Salinispira pacifica]|uniref:Uncharacterized protein n=1 Tax=Salinispira pacifica TaxID=1307761 RepID=V5WJ98_9SPIO|nr:hypothetical protein L21SP2_2357 [Salinispira pacifica]